MSYSFAVSQSDDLTPARLGRISTAHGEIQTPAFAPVGTQATVKALDPRDLDELGAELVLANTYHLYLRPGAETIARLGGLHRFMGWAGPILTDSGGFQVYSLAERRTVDADGVTFRSHIDGAAHRLTPESAVWIQEQLGSDIVMCLDECTEPTDRRYNESAMRRTHAWAERCQAAHKRQDQALFGIVQGGVFADLRQESARTLTDLGFAGYAIGGLSVGESKEQMHHILDVTVPGLPADRPRYLMGVGAPEDLLESVARGVDLFDCVLPTRLARNAALFTRQGRINLRNSRFATDALPIEPGCQCFTCLRFSRAYVRHLFACRELLAYRLATIHNLHFLLVLMQEIRASLMAGRFLDFKEAFLADYPVIPHQVSATSRAKRRERGALSSA